MQLYSILRLPQGLTNLSSSRGNTTLETAVTLTKALRWDIQSLGVRLEKAASAEESFRRSNVKGKSRAAHTIEILQIAQDIRGLLTRIEDAVPLINLAITTSGAKLSTALPASVSPSRLLQASTFLTAGDTQYSMNPNTHVQIGPTFTLSVYMLFAGHVSRAPDDTDSVRNTTWKEVIHKARVKLVRKPLYLNPSPLNTKDGSTTGAGLSTSPVMQSAEELEGLIPGEGKANEFAYHLEIVEDLNDDRVHSFQEDEPQPGPYEDVELAGIRETLPVYQVSKIFYADTGKILNIGSPSETNNPVLLLKRDINAFPPRRMMQDNENDYKWEETFEALGVQETENGAAQDDVDRQLRRESSVQHVGETVNESALGDSGAWHFPPNLDLEWLALEVYAEDEEPSSEDEQGIDDDSAYLSHRPSSSEEGAAHRSLISGLSDLKIDPESSPPRLPAPRQVASSALPKPSLLGPIRSSLSLLEMLIRLTSLQQFQQTSHLSIADELLTFFLEESSTTGAGGDSDERRRTRREARRKVGFDPYDDSPMKRRGESYRYQNQDAYRDLPLDDPADYDYTQAEYDADSLRWSRERSITPQTTTDTWLHRDSSGPVRGAQNIPPSSPASPYPPLHRRSTRPLERVRQGRTRQVSSPLGRGVSPDSSLGTSPGSPTLISRKNV
jgi:hypothetical protein